MADPRFDIRDSDSSGKLLLVIRAPTYTHAAQKAAKMIHKLPLATRETGWAGGSGVWSVRAEAGAAPAGRFWVGLTKDGRR
jgi:hypothetical protein